MIGIFKKFKFFFFLFKETYSGEYKAESCVCDTS